MLVTIKDYILCYSPAYAIGLAHGLVIAILMRPNKNKVTQWRKSHGK
jgi:hypothetical protein